MLMAFLIKGSQGFSVTEVWNGFFLSQKMPNILYTTSTNTSDVSVRIFTVAGRAALILRLVGVRTRQSRTHDRVTDNRLLLACAGEAGVVMRCPA